MTSIDKIAEAICACDGRVYHAMPKAAQMKYQQRAHFAINALGLNTVNIGAVIAEHDNFHHHSGDLFVCKCGASFLQQGNFDHEQYAWHVGEAVAEALVGLWGEDRREA